MIMTKKHIEIWLSKGPDVGVKKRKNDLQNPHILNKNPLHFLCFQWITNVCDALWSF